MISLAVQLYPIFRNEIGNLTLSLELLKKPACVSLLADSGEKSDCANLISSIGDHYFHTLDRPTWVGAEVQGDVLVDGLVWGQIAYIDNPILKFEPNSPPVEITVRNFFRPGWSAEIGQYPCTNCSAFNRLFLSPPSKEPCVGFPYSTGIWLDQLPITSTVESDLISFWTFTDARLDPSGRKSLFAQPLQLCFYPSLHEHSGIPAGTVQFLADTADSEVFVFLILFFLLCYPLMCLITWAFNAVKMKRMLLCIRNIKDHIQSQQLEYELILRNQP